MTKRVIKDMLYGKKEKELKIIKILKKLLDTKKTVLYN